ncbi:uncharacterized protein LOC105691584 [Athalia rosae]|uniref:uncharacterized protein LOC105691584 n=1 Tax=Athalia rosae TaxID=37344 RepID=UPI002033DAE8|nr:uncharacterized protein LOC105691584 [Athalia rosae]
MDSSSPPVKCGYCGWLIQGCRTILQHKCLEHYDEHVHCLKVDENFVVTLIPRPGATQSLATEEVDDENLVSDEVLIEAIPKRPALYNAQLPVKQRTKLKINALWLEISNTLGGMTAEDAKKRWQYMRECYMKEKKKQHTYTPSGSAAGNSKRTSFRHYDLMKFLGDSLPNTQTISNIAVPQSPSDSGCSSVSLIQDVNCGIVPPGPSSASSTFSSNTDRDSLMSPTPPSRTPTPGQKKRKLSESNADLRSALIDALKQPVAQVDAVDGMLLRLGEGL